MDDVVGGCADAGVDGVMSGMHERRKGGEKEDENGKRKKGASDAAVGGDGSRKGKRTTDNKSLGTLGTNTLQASFITLGRIVHKTGARGEPSTGTMYWCLQRYLEKIIIRTTRTLMAANQG